jgi:small-conductance mechanosensitive channel
MSRNLDAKEGPVRFWIGWSATLVAALGVVVALAAQEVVDASVTSVLYVVVVLAAGLGTKILVDRRRAAARQDADDSIELELGRRAAAATFPVALVALALLGVATTVRGEWGLTALCVLAVVLTVVTHWVTYARLRRQGV